MTWVLVALFALTATPPASAHTLTIDELHAGQAGARTAVTTSSSPPPCADRAYSLAGGRWTRTLDWLFRASSTPSGVNRAAALGTIKRSFANVTDARNDCGRADRVNATARYLGKTTRKPGCTSMDGRNVIGFKALPSGILAQACWWTINGRIVEADIQISSAVPWSTSLATCRDQAMLEAVMTHEIGHAYGLGHVGEKKHGRLTMSKRLDGLCSNQESTLGLGDMLGLEALY